MNYKSIIPDGFVPSQATIVGLLKAAHKTADKALDAYRHGRFEEMVSLGKMNLLLLNAHKEAIEARRREADRKYQEALLKNAHDFDWSISEEASF